MGFFLVSKGKQNWKSISECNDSKNPNYCKNTSKRVAVLQSRRIKDSVIRCLGASMQMSFLFNQFTVNSMSCFNIAAEDFQETLDVIHFFFITSLDQHAATTVWSIEM